jgi:putative molybdopterin biosynthesis protein
MKRGASVRAGAEAGGIAHNAATMNPTRIHLQYSFDGVAPGQQGADVEHPMFNVLAAVQEHGSIRHAAQALGRSYRHVWGDLKRWEETLQQPLVQWSQGKRAQLTPFGQRLLWAERQVRARMRPHIEALRAELQHALDLAHDPQLQVLELFASHDLALPRLQPMTAKDRLHLGLRFIPSEDALRKLNSGRCEVAGFHVPRLPDAPTSFAAALRPLLRPGEHKLIGSHSRVQGLMWRRGLPPVQGLHDVAAGALRFVNRQPGSGTRLLCDHLLAEAGLQSQHIDGYAARCEDTHVAMAAAIASGAADVGLGVQAAAEEFGLGFTPLLEEDYYLVCLKAALDAPAVQRLRSVLAAAAWTQALAALPGYRARHSGEVLSLTKALPWWRYATKKVQAARAA